MTYVTYAALALAALGFLMILSRGKKLAALEEECNRLKSLEWSYRELRKDMDAKIDTTRKYLAAVNEGKKIPQDAILQGRPLEDLGAEEEILGKIKETLAANKIAVFMKGTPEQPACGFSATVVSILNEMNVPFVGVNAVATPKFRTVLSSYSNWPTLPQVFVDGKLIGGCDIVKEMKASGELDQVIGQALGSASGKA